MVALQRNLFGDGAPRVAPEPAFERIPLDDRSWVDVARGYLLGGDELFDFLADTLEWKQGQRWMYDRMVDDPRLSRWYTSEPFPHQALVDVKHDLQHRYRVPLDSVGLNYYRDGRDSVAFHRDRELRHLDDTLIAIVTTGSKRPFLIRSRRGGPSIDVAPASGDLLVMGGRCQVDWEHGVPKSAQAGPRISASYRWSSKKGARDRGPSWRAPRRYGSGERRSRPGG